MGRTVGKLLKEGEEGGDGELEGGGDEGFYGAGGRGDREERARRWARFWIVRNEGRVKVRGRPW